MMPTPPDPLLVHDDRSRFATVALGFRTAAEPADRLHPTLHRLVDSLPPHLRPTWQAWAVDAQTARLAAALPAGTLPDMLTALGAALAELQDAALSGPVLAVVGDLDALDAAGLRGAMPWIGAAWPKDPLASSLRQNAHQGYEQLLVQGDDPAARVGPAATFLAMCLLVGSEQALLPRTVAESRTGAVAQLGRELVAGAPAVSWKLVAAQHRTLQAVDAVLAMTDRFRAAEHHELVAQARGFALANLNRAWRSPVELARTAAHYQVMGWSGTMLQDPDQHLGDVDDQQLESAIRRLARPLAEVTGRN